MKLKKILAVLSATAVAASMAVSASAYRVLSGPDNVGFDLASTSYGAVGDNSVGSSKPIVANYDVPDDVAASVASVDINLTCLDDNPFTDKETGEPTGKGGWANFQWYAAGAAWTSGYANADPTKVDESTQSDPNKNTPWLLKTGETIDIKVPLQLAQMEDGSYGYSVGFEVYGGGAYQINYISFLDASGNEVAKWAEKGTVGEVYEGLVLDGEEPDPNASAEPEPEPEPEAPADPEPEAPADPQPEAPADNNNGTGLAGIALVGIALSGATVVASKKRK